MDLSHHGDLGNHGGSNGPFVMGAVDKNLGSYTYGLCFLGLTSMLSAILIAFLPLRHAKNQA